MASFLVDLTSHQISQALTPGAAVTADDNGTGVDFLNTEGPVHFQAAVGAIDTANSDETYALKLQESDASGSGYTDIPNASVTVTAGSLPYSLTTHLRRKRYVRAVIDVGGTTPSIIVGATFSAKKKISGTGNGSSTV